MVLSSFTQDPLLLPGTSKHKGDCQTTKLCYTLVDRIYVVTLLTSLHQLHHKIAEYLLCVNCISWMQSYSNNDYVLIHYYEQVWNAHQQIRTIDRKCTSSRLISNCTFVTTWKPLHVTWRTEILLMYFQSRCNTLIDKKLVLQIEIGRMFFQIINQLIHALSNKMIVICIKKDNKWEKRCNGSICNLDP